MGARVAQRVAQRLGRSLLELGGNNAVIVTQSADLDLAVRAIVFGAVGTAGQRCTSTRRVIVHESLQANCKSGSSMPINRCASAIRPSLQLSWGPSSTGDAVKAMIKSIERLKSEGGSVIYGGQPLTGADYPGGCYVTPCLATARNDYAIVKDETFCSPALSDRL